MCLYFVDMRVLRCFRQAVAVDLARPVPAPPGESRGGLHGRRSEVGRGQSGRPLTKAFPGLCRRGSMVECRSLYFPLVQKVRASVGLETIFDV